MHVSVTVLGAKAGNADRAAGQIVGYLQGAGVGPSQSIESRRSQPGSQAQGVPPELAGIESAPRIGGYYADSAETAGRWRGQGALPEHFDLGTEVDQEAFRRVLLGQDPNTGRQLLQATGSSGRARGHARGPSAIPGDPNELLSVTQVADIIGVDASYVRRLAAKTAALRVAQANAEYDGVPAPETPRSHLDGVKDGQGRWVFSRRETDRFAETRKEPQMILGFDITWSTPKSVSALYAQGTDTDRAAIDESIEAAVAAGMAYIEREGFRVRRRGIPEPGSTMLAASYRHHTNRALEPQLHEHVIIANMATNAEGKTRAVDARGLFAHATTAGYLAGAELRTQLANRLGVRWDTPRKGLADIEGVSRETILAISSRRQAVLALADEFGYFTPQARQKAALATRPSKDHSVEPSELHRRWRSLLADTGFDVAAVEGLRDRNELRLWSPSDTDHLFRHLASHRGVTEQTAIFDRRDVIQAIASYANDRMPATEIEDYADQWLGTEAVIPLEVNDGADRETIGAGVARVSLSPDEQRYTTPHMLAIERRVIEAHGAGIGAGFAQVDARLVEQSITGSPVGLGADQASMVRSITTSGDQFQSLIGRAGAGKTTALSAAVVAWEDAGYRVVGAAPFGEAARKLEHETGLRSYTLEGLLTRIETASDPRDVIDSLTVIIVDEASTIGNRQLDRLYRHAAESGATVRTVGDPHQHQSVEAGGLWKHLSGLYADTTPVLDANRRQTGSGMAQVRLALDEYRNGQIAKALDRLDNDARIVTAPGWEELLDSMAADWFVDHQRRIDGATTESKMIAERNSDRHALNLRAQTLLHAAGDVGAPVTIGDTRFHIGDRVVAQASNPSLRAANREFRDHVINGSQGTVTAIKGSHRDADLLVDFDGLGEIRVPHEFIATEVGPGRGGGLAPGYAVTSFKAEGQTYDAGRNLAAPGAVNTEGMYVALTRGRNNQRTYTIAPDDQQLEPPELPIIADERTALEALADSLSKPRGTDLASVADQQAFRVAEQTALPLARLGGRARELAEARTASAAINQPDPVTVAALGPRPAAGKHREAWDAAVGEAAVYRARWGVEAVTLSGSVTPACPGDGPQRFSHFELVERLNRIADIERLTRIPLKELLEQRDAARSSLPTAPNLDVQRAKGTVRAAEEALWEAREGLDATRHNFEASQPRRRRDPNTVEATRRAVADASQAVVAAEVGLEQANLQLRASQGDNVGRAAVRARVAAFDRALDRMATDSVRHPSGYLIDALGDRPEKASEVARWDKSATSIEQYRHRHLGLTPKDGPLPGDGIERAIGPQPTSPSLFRPWNRVQEQIHQLLATSQSLERAR